MPEHRRSRSMSCPRTQARRIRRNQRYLFRCGELDQGSPYLALGQLTYENLNTSLALCPLAVASTWLGVLLVRRVPGERFIMVMNALLVLVGAKLIFDGARELLTSVSRRE